MDHLDKDALLARLDAMHRQTRQLADLKAGELREALLDAPAEVDPETGRKTYHPDVQGVAAEWSAAEHAAAVAETALVNTHLGEGYLVGVELIRRNLTTPTTAAAFFKYDADDGGRFYFWCEELDGAKHPIADARAAGVTIRIGNAARLTPLDVDEASRCTAVLFARSLVLGEGFRPQSWGANRAAQAWALDNRAVAFVTIHERSDPPRRAGTFVVAFASPAETRPVITETIRRAMFGFPLWAAGCMAKADAGPHE